MKVKELIKELRRYPMDAEVGWQDHDADDNEISNHVNSVREFDPETSFDKRYCKNIRVVLST